MEETKLKLDWSISDPKERELLVEKITSTMSPEEITPKVQDYFCNYIIQAVTQQEKKEVEGKGTILTSNRLVTVNNRETSYEGLVEKFENGEDGVYGLISHNNNYLLTSKRHITPEEIEKMPELKAWREEIDKVKERAKTMHGTARYKINQQLIQMHQDQYDIRSYYKPTQMTRSSHVIPANICLDEHITFVDGEPVSDGPISLFNPEHIRLILHDYENLKRQTEGQFNNDLYYLLQDLDNLINAVITYDHPLLNDLLNMKIHGDSNIEIQDYINNKYNVNHSIEYISSLWCNKIPELLADRAKLNYIMWYYTEVERGEWKTCTRCGQTKLAHNRFFSKNNTSKDGFYSICKACRNEKAQLEKQFGKEYVEEMYRKRKEAKKNDNA